MFDFVPVLDLWTAVPERCAARFAEPVLDFFDPETIRFAEPVADLLDPVTIRLAEPVIDLARELV